MLKASVSSAMATKVFAVIALGGTHQFTGAARLNTSSVSSHKKASTIGGTHAYGSIWWFGTSRPVVSPEASA